MLLATSYNTLTFFRNSHTPMKLIDLGFLVGDSTDDTLGVLAAELDRVQRRPDSVRFRSAMIVEKDFGVKLSQGVEDRHGWGGARPEKESNGPS